MAVANKIATIVCDGFPLGDGEVRRADETLEQPSSPMKPKCMKCMVIAADAPEIGNGSFRSRMASGQAA
jgi:hypothetical protein